MESGDAGAGVKGSLEPEGLFSHSCHKISSSENANPTTFVRTITPSPLNWRPVCAHDRSPYIVGVRLQVCRVNERFYKCIVGLQTSFESNFLNATQYSYNYTIYGRWSIHLSDLPCTHSIKSNTLPLWLYGARNVPRIMCLRRSLNEVPFWVFLVQ